MEMKSTAEQTDDKTILDCVIHSVRNHQVCYLGRNVGGTWALLV